MLVPLNLGTGSDPGRDSQVSGVRHINCHVEALGAGGKAQTAIFPAPGLTRFDVSGMVPSGSIRGMIAIDAKTLFAIFGNEVYQINDLGEYTVIGTLFGSGRVFMSRNRKFDPVTGQLAPQVAIVTNDNQSFFIEDSVVGPILDGTLPPPNSVFELDGYTIWTLRDGRFFISNLNELTIIQGLDFGVVESTPGDLLRGFAHNGKAYFFKEDGLEIWQNTGATNFPFETLQSDIDIGCLAAHTIREFSNALIWVDRTGTVQFLTDTTPERVSNHSLEKLISLLTDEEKANLEGQVYVYRGHEIYVLHSDGNWTYEFDKSSGEWNERKSYGRTDWRVTANEFFGGKYIVGSQVDGKLYAIDPDADNEDGEHLVMRVQAPVTHSFPGKVIVSAIHADLIMGQGLNSANIHDKDPQITMRFSQDGSNTWSNERSRPTGIQGNYKEVVSWLKCGQIKQSGHAFEFTMSSSTRRGILSIMMDVN